jgi:predicted RecA/RadA family phage recombinase
MSVITRLAAKAVLQAHGGIPLRWHFPEAASQSYKAGELVYLSGGKVTVCGNNPQTIMGMACADASGTTDEDAEVIVATPDQIFEASVYHLTAASAITAVSQVGENYGIEVVSNKVYVAIDETSTIACRVIGLSKKDVVGDQYGRLLFKIISTYSQYDIAG